MKSVVLSIRVPKDERESWRWYAKALKTSLPELIRVAISEHLWSDRIQRALKEGKAAWEMYV